MLGIPALYKAIPFKINPLRIMIPRIGDPLNPNQRYTLRPGAYCILPHRGRVLLTEEFENEPDIQLPGGGIDPGESLLQALYREVMEETGWTVGHPRRLGAFRRFTYMPEYNLWAEKLCHVFVAQPGRQIRKPSEPFHRTLWVSQKDAVQLLGNDGDRLFMIRYFRDL